MSSSSLTLVSKNKSKILLHFRTKKNNNKMPSVQVSLDEITCSSYRLINN